MWPVTNKREEDDTSKGPETPVTVEVPSQREETSDPIGNHIRTSSNSPELGTAEIQDRGQKPRLWASDLPNNFVPLHGHDGVSSWSASSDKQLGSPGSATDRVFPIRSVVSVDSSQTPFTLPGRNSSEHQEYFPPSTSPHGLDNAGGYQSRQSFSEANGKPTPRAQQHSRLSGERSRGERKRSTSTVQSDSDRYGGGLRMQLFSDATSEKSTESRSISAQGTLNSVSIGTHTPAEQESMTGLVTARFKHIVTAEGHAVITGRDGETLERCEDEP
jgi:hypothetical protein